MATPNYSSTSFSAPISSKIRLNSELGSDQVNRSKILLLGMRRAGKTSIQQVLFKNLPPKESFYVETTMRILKHRIDTVIPLEVWDCPGSTTVTSLGTPLSQFAAIIFIIDIRDLYNQPISKLVEFITAAYAENPEISVEVFVHKAEKLQEDDKLEYFRQVHERVTDRLSDLSSEYEQMHLNFHLTSVFDHTLHEAFSKVLHKLIDSLPYLEELLDVFCANSQSPKAFLFDIRSRLYVATDASPVDSATHNLCCDYLLMLNSFGPLYRSVTASPERQRTLLGANTAGSSQPQVDDVHTTNGVDHPDSAVSNSVTTTSSTTLRAPQLNGTSSYSGESSSIQPSTLLPPPSSTPPLTSAPDQLPTSEPPHSEAVKDERKHFYPSASTTLSASLSASSGSTTLTYHLITRNLALLALIPTAVFEEKRGLVEYNVVFFREGIQEICNVEEEVRGVAENGD